MSSPSQHLLKKKLPAILAILIGGGAAAFFFLKSPAEESVVADFQQRQSRAATADMVGNTRTSNTGATATVGPGATRAKYLKTKAIYRERDAVSGSITSRKEFWLGAKLPDDLVAASLPVLEAAVPPAPGELVVERDFATGVPDSFADEDTFDYKRANEELYLWLITEPEAASAWLSGQADFSKFDMAFGLVADSMALAGRPDIGEQWANLIPDAGKRESALVGMYAGMYLRRQAIPEDFRNRVLLSDRID